MVFHGEVLPASHQPQRICPQFFWICLCSDHLSAAPQSRPAILSVLCSTRSSSVFVLSLDLHGEVSSCFVMVVGAMVRSASAISGHLRVDHFSTDHSSTVGCLGAIHLASQHFFSRLGSLSLFFFNTLLFPRCDSTWRAFLFSLVPSVSFSPHGSPRYGFLSARFSSESARHKSQVRVAALIIASPSTRQARTARSRGESVPCFRGWAPSSFCRSGSVFVLQLRLGPRFTTVFCVLPRLWPRLHLCGPGSQKQGWS